VTGRASPRPGELDPTWVERLADVWDGWAVGEDGVVRTLYLAGDHQPLSSVSRRTLATQALGYLEPLLDVIAVAREVALARPGLESVRAMLRLDEALADLDRYLGPPPDDDDWVAPDYEQPPLL